MTERTTCPTCGSAVVLASGDEGTNHFIPADNTADFYRLLSAAARALERVQVDDSGEAEFILEQVVTLSGEYKP